MAAKDKLVTLEDLKTAYDKLKEMLDMYEDVTSSLTWNNATWYMISTTEKSNANAAGYTGVKVAKLPVSAGEKYRVYSWFKTSYASGTANAKALPFVLVDSSDAVIIASQGNDSVPIAINGTETFSLGFHESTITIPASCKYLYIFNHAGHADIDKSANDIIVEKAI